MTSTLRAVITGLALVVAACTSAGTPAPTPSPTAVPSASAAPSASASPSASPNACAPESLTLHTAGKLTVGTDNPAFPPWFGGDPPKGSTWQVSDPTSGKGLESAVAYAIAAKLGFSKDDVVWVAVPFNNAIQPGPKAFDFDVNQVSFSTERAQAVDLSDGYFDDSQAVVALKTNPIASASSVAALKAFRLGAQVGTTSYTYITANIAPTPQPRVYNTNDAAITGLKAKQIDGIVVDLGTAFYMTGAQLDNGTIVGSLPAVGDVEHFSAVLNKGSALTPCVNQAIAALKSDGTLDSIRTEWIESQGSVPALQ
jgi:polar amino acid transport system substrate-binding protein